MPPELTATLSSILSFPLVGQTSSDFSHYKLLNLLSKHYSSRFSVVSPGLRQGGRSPSSLRVSIVRCHHLAANSKLDYFDVIKGCIPPVPSASLTSVSPPSSRGQRPRPSTPLTASQPIHLARVVRHLQWRLCPGVGCRAEDSGARKAKEIPQHLSHPHSLNIHGYYCRPLLRSRCIISRNESPRYYAFDVGGARFYVSFLNKLTKKTLSTDGQYLLRHSTFH